MGFGILQRRGRNAPPSICEVVRSFESLGDNCEFGLVQRYVGAEPLGLFRFSALRLETLIEALDEDLQHYGVGDDLALSVNEAGDYVCRSQRYGFVYSTGVQAAAVDLVVLLRRETTKVLYLKRRLLEELAAGEKILVRKASPDDGLEAMLRLSRAVQRHGRCRLLWVREGGVSPSQPPRLHDATLIEDRIPRFAPTERAHAIDLEPWLSLARRIYGLVRGLPDVAAAPSMQRNLLSSAVSRPVAYDASGGEEIVAVSRRVDRLDPARIYTFSTWVWVPEGFVGERIGGLIGHFRLAYRDADLKRRACWQRVWVAAQWPERLRLLDMGLVVVGTAGSHFWRAGERLDAGPVPAPASPPRSAPPGSEP